MIAPARAAHALILAIATLAGASLFVSLNRNALIASGLGQFYRLFALNEEANIPTWFSAALLLCCALRLRYVTWAKDGLGDPDASYWRVLSLLFLFLSVDEIASFHEMATEPMRRAIGGSGLLYFAWVIPGMGIILLVLLVYSQFLRRLPRRIGVLCCVSGAVFVAGALGMEMLGGWWTSRMDPFEESSLYVLISTAEEVLEMAGASTFLYTILQPEVLGPTEDSPADLR